MGTLGKADRVSALCARHRLALFLAEASSHLHTSWSATSLFANQAGVAMPLEDTAFMGTPNPNKMSVVTTSVRRPWIPTRQTDEMRSHGALGCRLAH